MNLKGAIDKIKQLNGRFYDSSCTVLEFEAGEKSEGALWEQTLHTMRENVKCRISYQSPSGGEEKEEGIAVENSCTIFFPPEITIKPGSILEISTGGREKKVFRHTGISRAYETHQEIKANEIQEWS